LCFFFSFGMTTPEEPVVHDKLEVGWLFVQQYYTHLNEQPHRLHLFYTKKSTLCHGTEGEEIASFHGQTQIQQRIKEHDFEDCKVVISNMDCQESTEGGVVVQVLGEMSNKGKPSQKFVQTFFLASQPRGYFVLNDIFRFLKEDAPEFEEQQHNDNVHQNGQVATAPQSVPQIPAAAAQLNGGAKHQESSLFSQSLSGNSGPVTPNGGVVPEEPKTEAKVEAVELTPAKQPADAANPPAASETARAAAVTAVQSAPASHTSEPTQATKQKGQATSSIPSGPVSWAAMAAAKNTAKKEGALPNGSSPSAAPTGSAPADSAQSGAATSPVAVPAQAHQATPAPTSVSSTTKQPNGHQNGSRKTPEYHSAYIKHVSTKVDDNLLKKALDNIGVVTHFQVEKTKNCAFVDFVDEATLKAALAVHELRIGDQTVLVEERKRGGAKKNLKKSNNSSNKKPQKA
jgi:hypothetical protein